MADVSSAEVKEPIAPKVQTASKYSPASKVNDGTNLNSVLNLVGFFLSLLASYLGGIAGWFGGKPNSELNSIYKTLITPSDAYYKYIWALIFLSEGFFAVAQLMPVYRHHPLVQRGIGSFFFLACLAQTVWQILVGYELMLAASFVVFSLFLALSAILMRQCTVINDEDHKRIALINEGEVAENEAIDFTARPPTLAYFLLRFPFALHAGWVTTCTPVVIAMAMVQLGLDKEYEVWVSCISIPLVFGCCLGLLLREEKGVPSYVFPGACAYAFAGICWELYAPSNLILGRHDEATITLMKNLSGFCAACILIVIVSRCVALFLRDQCIKLTKKDETEEIDGVEYAYAKA